jgi:hypothetical protein
MKLDMAREDESVEHFLTQHQAEVCDKVRPLQGKSVKAHYVREQMEFRIAQETIRRREIITPLNSNRSSHY